MILQPSMPCEFDQIHCRCQIRGRPRSPRPSQDRICPSSSPTSLRTRSHQSNSPRTSSLLNNKNNNNHIINILIKLFIQPKKSIPPPPHRTSTCFEYLIENAFMFVCRPCAISIIITFVIFKDIENKELKHRVTFSLVLFSL